VNGLCVYLICRAACAICVSVQTGCSDAEHTGVMVTAIASSLGPTCPPGIASCNGCDRTLLADCARRVCTSRTLLETASDIAAERSITCKVRQMLRRPLQNYLPVSCCHNPHWSTFGTLLDKVRHNDQELVCIAPKRSAFAGRTARLVI